MARRKKKRAGIVEVIGGGVLRESLALGRTAHRELIAATDFMSGPKHKCRCRCK